ncbi:MAG: hypothetical protein ACNS60_03620 [Candidatus Cyclobacteriaceae bacterium M2_1C_046]
MGKMKRMDQVKMILDIYAKCGSIKGTARRLQISKNTVRHYIRLAEAVAIDPGQVQQQEEKELHQILYHKEAQRSSDREAIFKLKVKYWLDELPRTSVTRYLLWEEYKDEHPDGYEYSQFCELLKRHIARPDRLEQRAHLVLSTGVPFVIFPVIPFVVPFVC